jgi:hypothetical protein
MKITIVHAPGDRNLAARLRGDLEAAGWSVAESVQPGREPLLLAVLSPEAREDRAVQGAIIDALENRQHVIPVLAAPVELPRLIDHLPPLDFSQSYDAAPLLQRAEALNAPGAPPPLTTHTPSVRASNRRAGLIAGVLALLMFALGIYLIAFEGLGPPTEEFDAVETEIVLTRNYFIDSALPRSTEDAEQFAVTYDAARSDTQPALGATATAIAEEAHFQALPRTTEDAEAFPLTLESLSTVVHESVIATATAQAGGE